MYEAKNYDSLLGLPGFSEQALKTHFALYQGYVANANKFLEILAKEGTDSPDFAGFKRRFGWEFNGMRLHEYYFGALSKNPAKITESGSLLVKIKDDFGSFEAWEKDFRITAMMRGIGWTILYYDRLADKLLNVWIGEHDTGHLAGATPLLPLDVFEHAFLIDYGTKRVDYIEAFMKAIDWKVIEERFAKAE
ncbi:MAG: superoxide dismutase [Candidatus Nealsonbacteria bacterium]|nr:superoxide dismutase [Candidatus Nealsonbacteria bacterium]